VNPFGGCLPLILQMPIFFALYQVLGSTGKGKPGLLLEYLAANNEVGRFYFLISDIARTPKSVYADHGLLAALPYAILVVIFGLSVWLPQALMPGERQQKMIGLYMAAVMLFFGWSSPAGVLLYWDVSSIWGVVQQQLMTYSMKKHGEEETPAPEAVTSKNQGKTSAKKSKSSKKSQG
jgi:YidC/Oxa1 family membrane protein insertase